MKIKYKFLFITTALVLIPMAISTAVISIVVQRQNDFEAWNRVDGALHLVLDEIDLRANRMQKGIRTFLHEKAVTDVIQLITEKELDFHKYPLLMNAANQLAVEMQKFASSAEFERIFLYYPDGRLMGLHWNVDGDSRFSFYLKDEQGQPTNLSKECRPRQDCQPVPWEEEHVESWPTAAEVSFDGDPHLLESGNVFSMEIAEVVKIGAPKNAKAPSPVKIAIHKQFNLAFAQRFSDLTGTDIQFFTALQTELHPTWNAQGLPADFLAGLQPEDIRHEKLRLETSYYAGFRPFIDKTGKIIGVVTTRFPGDGTIAKTWEARISLMAIAAFSILLMIPVALFLSHQFVKPIHGLIEGSQSFGKGNLAYRIPEKGSDEIGELATAFNNMAGSIQRAQGELEHLNQRLEEYNRDLEQKIYEATEALVEKNREMQDDLNFAAEFQSAILSAIPSTSFLLCAMKYIPYGGGVSGDVYDMSIDRDGAANIFLGDATGHGVAAAIMTMMAQIGLDSLEEDLSTDEIIRQLNSLFASRERDMSITGVFMRIAPSGKLSVTNAGHPPVIVVPADGHAPVHLKEGGTPLGMFKEELAPFVELEYSLKAGDKIFLYTDGITEWQNPEGDEFGIERLTEFLMQNGDAQVDATLSNLLNHVNRFSMGRPCEDDLTLLGFQYQPI